MLKLKLNDVSVKGIVVSNNPYRYDTSGVYSIAIHINVIQRVHVFTLPISHPLLL